MTLPRLKSFPELDSRPPLDRWLRFAAPIQAQYDSEHASERVEDLRSAILVGLILYNVFNFTSIVTLPDILVLSVFIRLALVTPVSLGIFWAIRRTSPIWTERVVAIGLFNAYLFPAFLFYWTTDPDGLFTFMELLTIIVFSNMLIALRFYHAVILTSVIFLVTVLVLATKPGLSPPHFFVLMVQLSAISIFTLYANYRLERRRCRDYLATFDARLQAHSAMADRKVYEDASRTDALTQLPNRRHLDERMELWLSERRAMALMMIDVDHFKLYNDTLGHPAGDECLRRIAAALASVADQAEDAICARFGGEEFTFAISCRSEFEAARWARILSQAITALEIAHPARTDGIGIVTISIGVARCPSGTLVALNDLVAAADRALYVAKRRGRNRFVMDDESSLTVQFAG
ncbi:MAG: GGDEF domain-containing protein [Fulvimarina manganoxydans]|uniref:GGDEF domain-containing protein n=1 Tax=Fulvimarina manganoxydans TaxID=937218 RepID=UPI0023570FFF|nr:GGDEF domain-containing protein [Fulvimarina manganoxydans]MCK5931356.1 GGDEF domain-containing protein [Fulvimarina manganoxydans]